jgi:hypothetical protein
VASAVKILNRSERRDFAEHAEKKPRAEDDESYYRCGEWRDLAASAAV